ncbi:hypothetical protein [Streptomyces guryensis]|uniref:Glycosyl hydrolases family 43 n=1 Tax=Streptomyces guryensis TaxID=2886947 RepID=A0A9Q3VUK4_9ACTN|nr:hypothetical protein [Streptomyces guryensis]MCD9878437.1 hypothetical protein [Streptomyces guryensis]
MHWLEQRHVKVSGNRAGPPWAPEATWDPTLGAYVAYRASNLYAADDTQHTGTTYPRMKYVTTRDFRTFSEPKVGNDPGGGVIDSAVVKDGDWYYRVTTDDKAVGSYARHRAGTLPRSGRSRRPRHGTRATGSWLTTACAPASAPTGSSNRPSSKTTQATAGGCSWTRTPDAAPLLLH